jgi:hypothetical protein
LDELLVIFLDDCYFTNEQRKLIMECAPSFIRAITPGMNDYSNLNYVDLGKEDYNPNWPSFSWDDPDYGKSNNEELGS